MNRIDAMNSLRSRPLHGDAEEALDTACKSLKAWDIFYTKIARLKDLECSRKDRNTEHETGKISAYNDCLLIWHKMIEEIER